MFPLYNKETTTIKMAPCIICPDVSFCSLSLRKCLTCEFWKPLEAFYSYKRTTKCKNCESNKNKKYRKENASRERERKRKYRENNKEKRREYCEKNRERIRECERINEKKRRMNEPSFNERIKFHSALTRIMQNGSQEKSNLCKYFKMDLPTFREQFEKKFTKDMTWSNHGTLWEVDLIVPISVFDLTKEENRYYCFHPSNIRPLLKEHNQEKRNKYNENDLQKLIQLVDND